MTSDDALTGGEPAAIPGPAPVPAALAEVLARKVAATPPPVPPAPEKSPPAEGEAVAEASAVPGSLTDPAVWSDKKRLNELQDEFVSTAFEKLSQETEDPKALLLKLATESGRWGGISKRALSSRLNEEAAGKVFLRATEQSGFLKAVGKGEIWSLFKKGWLEGSKHPHARPGSEKGGEGREEYDPGPPPEHYFEATRGTMLEGKEVEEFHEMRNGEGREGGGWEKNFFGLAQRLADLYRHKLKFVDGKWRVYESGVWTEEVDKEKTLPCVFVRKMIQKLEDLEAWTYSDTPRVDRDGTVIDKSKREYFIEWVRGKKAPAGLVGTLKVAASMEEFRAERKDFDQHPMLLNVKNGVLNLETRELLPHSPEYLFTQQARANWNPQAECPTWDTILTYQIPDDKERAWVETSLAYASLRHGNHRKLFFMLIGPKDSGKSRILVILGYTLGSYAKPVDLTLFKERKTAGPRPDVIDVLGCRLVYVTEPAGEVELHAEQVKRVAGNDELSGRALFSNVYVTGKPAFTALLACNNVPIIKNADEALKRRLIVEPFPQSVPVSEQIMDIDERLEKEADGILRRLVERLADEAVLDSIPPRFAFERDDAFSALAPLTDFIQQHFVDDLAGEVSNTEVVSLYQHWCGQQNIQPKDQLNAMQLGLQLKGLGWQSAPKAKRFGGALSRYRIGKRRLRPLELTGGETAAGIADQAATWLASDDPPGLEDLD